MCTGRVDLAFLLRAFSKGADGVFIAGCRINECNYLTQGNFYALSLVQLGKRLMEQAGIHPDRLAIELLSGGEANRFVDIVNGFTDTVRSLGPLGSGDEADQRELGPRLDDLLRLVPYIKLHTGEKLRTRLQTEEEYQNLFTREEVEQLLADVESYYIDPARCQACMMCAKRCPVDAIEGGKKRIHVIDQQICIKCGKCFETCPPRFSAVAKYSGEPVPRPIPEDQRTIDRKKKSS